MRSVLIPQSSYRDRVSLRSRAFALILAIAISALMILMIMRLGVYAGGPALHEGTPTVVSLLPAEDKASKASKQQVKPKVARTKPVVPKKPPIVLPPTTKLNMIVLSHEDFAASDLSRLSPHPAEATADAGTSGSAGDDASVGQGPNGEKLYNAEWYREPTHAEMATYLPSMRESGWGMIACKTIPRYHVEDCQELGESPPGSGLARAVRQAAWQFLVRPPRVGGKPMVGEWVRIRFDFTEEKRADRN